MAGCRQILENTIKTGSRRGGMQNKMGYLFENRLFEVGIRNSFRQLGYTIAVLCRNTIVVVVLSAKHSFHEKGGSGVEEQRHVTKKLWGCDRGKTRSCLVPPCSSS